MKAKAQLSMTALGGIFLETQCIVVIEACVTEDACRSLLPLPVMPIFRPHDLCILLRWSFFDETCVHRPMIRFCRLPNPDTDRLVQKCASPEAKRSFD
uniref:Secreted protein n=1 Tax=Kalanchoe fedtschenkoi TaxID=63787 RepID=A0A7N0TK60_KALFE